MNLIGMINETSNRERRCALIPDHLSKLKDLGFAIAIVKDAGKASGYPDDQFKSAGAKIYKSNEELIADANILVCVKPPADELLEKAKNNLMYIGFVDPYRDTDIYKKIAVKKRTIVSMDMVPRITRAQSMDALSSQANLSGYTAVISGMSMMTKAMPMMMTAAGTIQPARVFILGAGVAGLQAIATAKRLGARVEAFDTRAVVEEQVKSLGAKFVKVDLGETAEVSGGYAGQLTDEQLAKQREVMKQVCARSDLVITTAQVFGHKAPTLVTKDMINAMKPGAIIVDLAVETGGNVEGSKLDKVVEVKGVKIIGPSSLASDVAGSASQVYSANIVALLNVIWDVENSKLASNEDEIVKSCVLCVDGKTVHEQVAAKL